MPDAVSLHHGDDGWPDQLVPSLSGIPKGFARVGTMIFDVTSTFPRMTTVTPSLRSEGVINMVSYLGDLLVNAGFIDRKQPLRSRTPKAVASAKPGSRAPG
jgi:hypothetical protein